ncbi:hypothetical protein C2S51_008016 [Perilla frutescens var. frutescens]|nr:hypothetical protein C2S51_008016 [Perilla frutescens var. frutescens]
MEGTAIAATIRVVFENLIKVTWNEISLIRNLDKDAQKLRKNLAMTESYLIDAEKKVITQQFVKTWLKELESLAFDADDVLDELNYRILRNKAVNKKVIDLGLESIVMNAPAPAAAVAAAFETDSFIDDPVFIGRDDDVPLLVEELINGAEEGEFSILSDVGMGGMGKTTLARKVFNNQKMKTQFGYLIWVLVSQTCNPITLFKKILASLASAAAKKDKSWEEVSEKIQKSFKSKTDEAENREVILKNLQEALKDFKCLHALTLINIQVEELSNSVRKLIHLRRLNIFSCRNIKDLPEWIGELHHLQTIRVSFGLKKLPSTIKYLSELRHLIISSYTELLAEIGRLTSLRTLSCFRVGDKKGYKIEELGSLKNLKGTLHICNLGKVHDKDEALKANIYQKSKLTSLYLDWDFTRRIDERNNESVLEGLQPHPNIKALRVDAFKGKRFPLWIMKMTVQHDPQGSWINLNKLAELTLSWCDECAEIPALGHLPNLKSLRLQALMNLKLINSSFYGIDNNIEASKDTTINVFSVLKMFELSCMPELREWAKVETIPNCEVKLFPHLKFLTIEYCRHITLANIFELKLTSLIDFYINDLDELECLPDWLFYNNQNLTDLTIVQFPQCIIELHQEKLRLVVENSKELRDNILTALHNSSYVGHSGIHDGLGGIDADVMRCDKNGVFVKLGLIERGNSIVEGSVWVMGQMEQVGPGQAGDVGPTVAGLACVGTEKYYG